MPVHWLSVMIEASIAIDRAPMAIRVAAALSLLGLRKAGNPVADRLDTARVAQPDEKARSSRKARAAMHVSSWPSSGSRVSLALSAAPACR